MATRRLILRVLGERRASAHPAFADLGLNDVVPDCPPNHLRARVRRRYRPPRGTVKARSGVSAPPLAVVIDCH